LFPLLLINVISVSVSVSMNFFVLRNHRVATSHSFAYFFAAFVALVCFVIDTHSDQRVSDVNKM